MEAERPPNAVRGRLRNHHLLLSSRAIYSFLQKLTTQQVRLGAALA